MGLMQGLYTGVSGLTVAQRGLTATAHNLSNVETPGYIRQQAVQETAQVFNKSYTAINTTQVGIGVDTAAIYQYRDTFLDASYRRELGRQSFYDTQYAAVCEIEELFGELQGVAFQDTLEDFWTSMQELSKEPGNLTARATMVETAISFIERAENISDLLQTYQRDLDTEIGQMVERINEIGDELVALNDKICFYESNGTQHANDLRDTRNLLLDELAEMVNITYRENLDSRVSVSIEGIPFVEKMSVNIVAPDTIKIIVYEKAVAGYIEYLGKYMYFDKDGIIVETSDVKTEGIPQITGLKFDYVVLHEKLPIENQEIFQSVLDIIIDDDGLAFFS